MPLRLDNAKGVAHMPTAGAAKNKSFEPRFKIDHAASPMPETRQPERLAPRATSNRNGGRDHLGILGEIKSVHPGEIIGIRIYVTHDVNMGTEPKLAHREIRRRSLGVNSDSAGRPGDRVVTGLAGGANAN
jgi:hypothetical protein